MSIISKIRGLWRFDGDTEPVLVSRRRFLFLGACVAGGAALPSFLDDPVLRAWNACVGGDEVPVIINYDSFCAATLKAYEGQIAENFLEYRPSLNILLGDDAAGPKEIPWAWDGWTPAAKGSPRWYVERHQRKQARKLWS